MERRFYKPVQEGKEYEVTIEAVGEKGDGIAKIEGFVVFVPGAKAGEKVKIKVDKVLRKFAIGSIIGEAEKVEVAEAPENPVEEDTETQENVEETTEQE